MVTRQHWCRSQPTDANPTDGVAMWQARSMKNGNNHSPSSLNSFLSVLTIQSKCQLKAGDPQWHEVLGHYPLTAGHIDEKRDVSTRCAASATTAVGSKTKMLRNRGRAPGSLAQLQTRK